MCEHSSQIYRILSMYDRLSNGEVIVKKFEADSFRVDEKTIQRDFNHIRAFLAQTKTHLQLVYDRKDRVYKLTSIQQILREMQR